jgi:hypothetical protein
MACLHEGNVHQHRDGIKEIISYVASTKNCFAFIVGDIGDGIDHTDKRWERTGQTEQSILEQYNGITDLFMPIKSRLLGAIAGNHDWKLNHWGDCVKDVFCKRLEIPYGTAACKLIVSDLKGKLQYKAFAHHPFTGQVNSNHPDPIMREAVETSQVKRKLALQRMGDCILNISAHFHKGRIAKPFQDLYLVDDGKTIKQKYHREANPTAEYIPEDLRWFASVPGFVKKHVMGLSGYVERSGYAPVELGVIRSFTVAGKVTHVDKKLV